MTRTKAPGMLPLAALLTLSGCAGQGDFPSLERRPAELALEAGAVPAPAPGRIGGSGVPALPAPDAAVRQEAVPADLPARLEALRAAAREAHGRFMGKRARAGELMGAARGAAVGSEAWSVASVALADLESARSDAMISLGELDRLYAAERIDGGDGGAIAAVRDQVTAWVADEDAVLADLSGRLKG